MGNALEFVIAGVHLTQTPLVFKGACPWCDDAKQYATASSRLWEIRAGHTCSHYSWGFWEVFRYASFWWRSAENLLKGSPLWLYSKFNTINILFWKGAKKKKYDSSNSQIFQGIFSIWLSLPVLGRSKDHVTKHLCQGCSSSAHIDFSIL